MNIFKYFLIGLVTLFFIGCSPRYERFCYDGVNWVVCPEYAKPGDTISPQPTKKAKTTSKKKSLN